jgi:hypothetical protein
MRLITITLSWLALCISVSAAEAVRLIGASGNGTGTGTRRTLVPTVEERAALEYLALTARTLLAGCVVPATDGTRLYTPDGKGNYKALWTRDFAYMVENAADLIPAQDIEGALRYLIKGQRSDGAMPDRVRPDGVAVYVAGGENSPLGEPNLDNPPFLVLAADAYLRRLPAERAEGLYKEWSKALDAGMAYLPRGSNGLIRNDPHKPHSPYGFTDTVAKTGELFMESLLYWQACRQLAAWEQQAGGASADEYARRAALIETNLGQLWDETAGMFLAASQDCRQVDVWGNAYAVYINFPLGPKRERIVRFLVENRDRYLWRGQVRHLLKGEYWERMLTPIPRDRYQNGAYWATASGWVFHAIAGQNPDLARSLFTELIEDFQKNGVCECVNEGYRQLPSYVASATNPLGAARQLFGLQP